MHRRQVLTSAAASLLATSAGAAGARLRITLLGQALILHDVCAQDWPARSAIKSLLSGSDVVFTDLETALQVPGAGEPTREPLLLHAAPPSVLGCLQSLGVSMLSTAGNHAWDLGTQGIASALPVLDQARFVHAGTGLDMAAASAPAVQPTRHGRVALVATATGAIREGAAATALRPGVNELRRDKSGAILPEDLTRTLDAIRQARKGAEVVMLYHHNHDWEPDNGVTPPWQRQLARAAIDAGAGLFVSHGAPKLHGVEIYRGAPIFYDLGNFMFQTRTVDDRYGAEAWEAVVVNCDFDGSRFRRAVLTPIVLNEQGAPDAGDLATRGRPGLAPAARGATILDRIDRLSRPYGARLTRAAGRSILSS